MQLLREFLSACMLLLREFLSACMLLLREFLSAYMLLLREILYLRARCYCVSSSMCVHVVTA